MLTFLNISPDYLATGIAGRADIVRWRPKCARLPDMVADWLAQLLAETPGGDTFEQFCQIGWTVLGRRRHELMDVVRHYFVSENFKSVLIHNFVQQFFQTISYLSGQHSPAVLGTPNQVIVQVVHCTLGVLNVHILIVAQMFCVDNLNRRRKAASSPDNMSGVSAAEIL